MVRMLLIACLAMGLFSVAYAQTALSEYRKVSLKMGSRFEIIALSSDPLAANKAIDAGYLEIDRIEQLISSWQPHSETSKINQMAGQSPVPVSKELYDLIYRCLKLSNLTNGAFDISFAGLEPLWEFAGKEVQQFPDSSQVTRMVDAVDYKQIFLDNENKTVYLAKPGMKIGFGSIGKGFAANQAMKIMKSLGIASGMVNAGGDLITWGKNQEGIPWSMGIADPNAKDQMLAWLSLEDMALVTSGDYEKYFLYKNERYAHILDPRTGYPAMGIKSVTVVCPDVELADALATAVFVLGEQKGIQLINQLKGIECLMVTADNRLVQSKNLALNYYAIQD